MWWVELQGLPKLMGELARARADWEAQDRIVAAAEMELSNTREYLAVREARIALGVLKTRMDIADAVAREQALDDFARDGEKAVFAGVSVKMFRKVRIDAGKVKAWAIQHMPNLLVLDIKAVKEIALTGALDAEMAEVYTEPQVQIAGDLSGYLAENVGA